MVDVMTVTRPEGVDVKPVSNAGRKWFDKELDMENIEWNNRGAISVSRDDIVTILRSMKLGGLIVNDVTLDSDRA